MVRILFSILFFLMLIQGNIIAQEAQNIQSIKDDELQQKKLELEKKAVEVLDLRSALTIQNSELEDLKNEVEEMKKHNTDMEDSLRAKQTEIEKLKLILKAFDEDKKFSQKMVETIRSSQDSSQVSVSSEISDSTIQIDDFEFRSRYNEVLNLYFDKKYDTSIKKFKDLLSLRTDHSLSDNCQYWLGECYYSLEKYQEAISEFKKVGDLGDRNKADAALFKIGMSYLKIGEKEKAVSAFENLEEKFPNSELLAKAKEYLTIQEKF
ncbi:MAG: hypothetical protein DRP89_00445 [Candidatus Neomarinimicrobiota bacterium]|nr:MAG: hypothetical protein DRP89_00445 [Candidatus Neomarinimicrobiota bacterium]